LRDGKPETFTEGWGPPSTPNTFSCPRRKWGGIPPAPVTLGVRVQTVPARSCPKSHSVVLFRLAHGLAEPRQLRRDAVMQDPRAACAAPGQVRGAGADDNFLSVTCRIGRWQAAALITPTAGDAETACAPRAVRVDGRMAPSCRRTMNFFTQKITRRARRRNVPNFVEAMKNAGITGRWWAIEIGPRRAGLYGRVATKGFKPPTARSWSAGFRPFKRHARGVSPCLGLVHIFGLAERKKNPRRLRFRFETAVACPNEEPTLNVFAGQFVNAETPYPSPARLRFS